MVDDDDNDEEGLYLRRRSYSHKYSSTKIPAKVTCVGKNIDALWK